MNPTAIYSKTGKGVQEASGKTSALSRADRAVLAAIDGRASVNQVAEKCGKQFDAVFQALVARLDQDGYIRSVTAGGAAGAGRAPARAPHKPASPSAPASSATSPMDLSSDLDFSSLAPPPRKAAPPPPAPVAPPPGAPSLSEQESALAKARREAEEREQKQRERIKAEAEARLRFEAEEKLRAAQGAAAKGAAAAEAEAKLRAEAEAKVKAARDAAVRAAAEAKAKAEAEMKAKLEAERAKLEEERRKAEEERRKAAEEAERARQEAERARQEAERQRREAEEKARREAEELKKKLEEERARAEAEQRAREEAERARKEAEEKARQEAEALRRQLEDERRKLEEERTRRDEEERKAAEDRRRREDEERAERMRREEQERTQREEEDRKRRDQDERARREDEDRRQEAQAKAKATLEATQLATPVLPPAPAAQPKGGAEFGDSLMADLESFGQREEEERKAKEETERKAKEETARLAREQAERQAHEQAERQRREAEEQRRREEAARRAREDEERQAREEEERLRREDEERKRKARELMAAAKPAQGVPAADEDDIGITDEDLDMEDVKRDEQLLSAEARKAAREREVRKERAPEPPVAEKPSKPVKIRRPVKWGKPVATTFFLLLVAAVVLIHFVPIPPGEYESAASEAFGRPVKIGSAHFSLYSGLEIRAENVTAGDARIGVVRAHPELGALFSPQKTFSRIELDGVTLPQNEVGPVLLAKLKGNHFAVERLLVHDLKLAGALPLPMLDADIAFNADGTMRAARFTGPESLVARLAARNGEIDIEATANQYTLPVAPDITLSQFGMKGTASSRGLNIASWNGGIFDGSLSGSAILRWGSGWSFEGVVTARGVNAAVLAPALLSEGRAEGTGRFTMSGAEPAKLTAGSRLEGNFTVNKGALGSFDLSRAIQTSGRQVAGRTQFSEMTGHGVYDKGMVSLQNVNIGAGALSAGASAEIAQGGALSGRIVADVRTASQTLRATLNLGGTVKEPQVRN